MSFGPFEMQSPFPILSGRTPSTLRLFQAVALGALALGLFLPPQGLGFTLCVFYTLTGLPCPGCGLTRSVSGLLHGDLAHSLRYHPLGFLALAGLSALAISGFVPPLAGWMLERRSLLQRILLWVGIAFVAFGMLRLAVVWLGIEGFESYTEFSRR